MEIIPKKNRPEWRKLLTGQLDVQIENFVLQMQVDNTRRAINSSKMTVEQGIDKIHELCVKYTLAVKSDMNTIFHKTA